MLGTQISFQHSILQLQITVNHISIKSGFSFTSYKFSRYYSSSKNQPIAIIESPRMKQVPSGWITTPLSSEQTLSSLCDKIQFKAWSIPFNTPTKTRPSFVIILACFSRTSYKGCLSVVGCSSIYLFIVMIVFKSIQQNKNNQKMNQKEQRNKQTNLKNTMPASQEVINHNGFTINPPGTQVMPPIITILSLMMCFLLVHSLITNIAMLIILDGASCGLFIANAILWYITSHKNKYNSLQGERQSEQVDFHLKNSRSGANKMAIKKSQLTHYGKQDVESSLPEQKSSQIFHYRLQNKER